MSGHCKACDKELSEGELVSKFKRADGEVEYRDLCSTCHTIAMQAAHGDDYIDEDQATIQEILDGRNNTYGTVSELSE